MISTLSTGQEAMAIRGAVELCGLLIFPVLVGSGCTGWLRDLCGYYIWHHNLQKRATSRAPVTLQKIRVWTHETASGIILA